MSEMISRISKVIEQYQFPDGSLSLLPDNLAAVIVACMREPTQAMIGAARYEDAQHVALHQDAWRTMIDAEIAAYHIGHGYDENTRRFIAGAIDAAMRGDSRR